MPYDNVSMLQFNVKLKICRSIRTSQDVLVIIIMTLSSNEEVTLYPMIPDPSNEGAVHMFTEQRLLAENLKVVQPTMCSHKK